MQGGLEGGALIKHQCDSVYSLSALIERASSQQPTSVAVVEDENRRACTRSELQRSAARLAARLKSVRGCVIGVCMPRCIEMVTAVLGILAAGLSLTSPQPLPNPNPTSTGRLHIPATRHRTSRIATHRVYEAGQGPNSGCPRHCAVSTAEGGRGRRKRDSHRDRQRAP